MPFGSFEQEGKQALSAILAAVFWLFFALGFVFLRPISRQRKKDRQYRDNRGFALFQFFSNRPALVFDILLIAGIAALVLTFTVPSLPLPGWTTLAATFTAVFSLEMHGVFNGKNYAYLINK
jgi:multisubunit Na+/H+ antiporter MnhB subunit